MPEQIEIEGARFLIEDYDFGLDHFGIVSSNLVRQLIDQSSNRRSRKSALHNLSRMAKASKQIPREANVQSIGLTSNHGGEIFLRFSVIREVKVHEPKDT